MTIMRSTSPHASGSSRERAKATTHRRIVSSAARLLRRNGLAGASVPAVMRGAGLTVGGFYAHFRSKRAMDAEVLRTLLAERAAIWFSGLETSSGITWVARAVKRYLSAAHRDAPEDGCPLPAVLPEVARADRGTRSAVTQSLEPYVSAFAAHVPPSPQMTARERAIATLALCIGGVALARAWEGPEPEIREEILRACAKWALPELRAE
jgi:TetR/AcrR family transcriptional repressor of nem operon